MILNEKIINLILLKILILKSVENKKKKIKIVGGTNNKKEIKENCKLYINNEKIDFYYKYKFLKVGKYLIKIINKKPLSIVDSLFCNYNKLVILYLSKFTTNNINKLNFTSLNYLNLSNYKIKKVKEMSYIFCNCSFFNFLNQCSLIVLL